MTAGEFKLVYTFRCHEYSHCKNKYFCPISSVEPEPNLASVLLNSVLTGEWQNVSNQFRKRKCHRNNNRILSIDSASTEYYLVPLTRCIALTTAPKTKTTLLIVRFFVVRTKDAPVFRKRHQHTVHRIRIFSLHLCHSGRRPTILCRICINDKQYQLNAASKYTSEWVVVAVVRTQLEHSHCESKWKKEFQIENPLNCCVQWPFIVYFRQSLRFSTRALRWCRCSELNLCNSIRKHLGYSSRTASDCIDCALFSVTSTKSVLCVKFSSRSPRFPSVGVCGNFR